MPAGSAGCIRTSATGSTTRYGPPYAISPDGSSIAISHRRGTAVWDVATDTLRFALHDPAHKPLPYPYGD
jgi:hypothetical protein